MASQPVYDAIVVGTGAAGGIAAYVLTTQGLNVDAACFVSHPEKATTHTIMALAYRATDHLAEDFRLGNI